MQRRNEKKQTTSITNNLLCTGNGQTFSYISSFFVLTLVCDNLLNRVHVTDVHLVSWLIEHTSHIAS